MCDEKWILYDNWWQPAQWLNQEEPPKHFHSQICTQKMSGSLAVCCWTDPLQLSEFQQNHYLWEVCSANQWDALKTAMPAANNGQQKRAQVCSKTTPDHMLQNQCFKSWTNWAAKFCLICDIHLTLANQLPLLQPSRQLFAGKMLPQPAGCRICFPRVRWILKIFTLQE